MITNLQGLVSQALKLFPTERIDLAEQLLESVDYFSVPQIEDRCRGVAERCLPGFEIGEADGIPADALHWQIWVTLNETGLPS